MTMSERARPLRITLARGYIPRPGIRRAWPAVARAYGLKRMLTGISFEGAQERMRSYPTLLATLTPEQLAAAQAYDPWVIEGGAPARDELAAD
ncbi:MAG TPA: hypothetical protein VFJ16_27250 [Longimicrobium sp.]|nr:hypothetical protein [Longimicrobium sp.]